jgi:hypothetical protein
VSLDLKIEHIYNEISQQSGFSLSAFWRSKMSALPEYETLREEIGRLQDQAARSLEIGILITSGIYTISYSSIIGSEFQWLALMSPSILIIPFVYLIVERVRTTWFIGRYIEFHLEPKLGFHWEAFNRKLRGNTKGPVRSRFARSSVTPLIGLQILSPILAFTVGVPHFLLWLGLTIAILLIIALELRWTSNFSVRQNILSMMEAEIKNINQEVPAPTNATKTI